MTDLPQVPEAITVHTVKPNWITPEGEIKGWKLIIEMEGRLMWVYTHDQKLATPGIKYVKFSRPVKSHIFVSSVKSDRSVLARV